MSGLPDGGRRQGRARRHRGNPTNFCSVTASGNCKGAIECLRQELANDAGIEAQLEGTKNAVFAKYAFGGQR